MTGRDITVYGDGLQTRDYVYIDDVVDAFIRAAVSPRTNGEIYFIGSGIETVFLDMVKEVIRAVGSGRYVHVPFPPERESIDIRRFVVSYRKFQEASGCSPRSICAKASPVQLRFTANGCRIILKRKRLRHEPI